MISMDESFFEVDDLPNLTIISLTSEAWVKTNTLANTLREKNVVVVNSSANKSFKSQMRYANQIKSKFLMVVGENELNNDDCIFDIGNETIKIIDDTLRVNVTSM